MKKEQQCETEMAKLEVIKDSFRKVGKNKMDAKEKYKDIINLPHHTSSKHPHMSRSMRGAQFSSFAALSGFEDEVKETAETVLTKGIGEMSRSIYEESC